MTTNPTFTHLMQKYADLHDAGLDSTKEARQLFAEAMNYAPEEFKKIAHDTAVELGLIPDQPDYYTNDGEPLYALNGLAERLGIDPAHALADMPDCIKQNFHTDNVHRVN